MSSVASNARSPESPLQSLCGREDSVSEGLAGHIGSTANSQVPRPNQAREGRAWAYPITEYRLTRQLMDNFSKICCRHYSRPPEQSSSFAARLPLDKRVSQG
jgi:hypothetical protein